MLVQIGQETTTAKFSQDVNFKTTAVFWPLHTFLLFKVTLHIVFSDFVSLLIN